MDIRALTKRHFLMHYLEMVVAMIVSTVVLGAIGRGVMTAAGIAYSMDRHLELAALEMAAYMAMGMVVWMRFRRHSWAGSLEMAAAMLVPALLLAPLSWAGIVSGGVVMLVSHLAMFPLMLVVMLRRHGEYAR